jgi:hypothetical protein
MLPSDGAIHALNTGHCRDIAYVVRMLCGITASLTATQEADGIVSTFLQAAQAVEGRTTYGTSGERYEAAVGVRRDVEEITGRSIGPSRYLIDSNTGEYVIAVSDLQDAARRFVGSSLPHGWLDGRMETLGWARITIEGWSLPGRDGRKGPHARVNAYRGVLTSPSQDEPEGVNT